MILTQTKDFEDIPMANHEYGEPIYEWSTDGTRCTATVICTNDPTHIITCEGEVTYQVDTDPTCEGYGVYTHVDGAKYEGYWKEDKTNFFESSMQF